jgi:hypothetical protein
MAPGARVLRQAGVHVSSEVLAAEAKALQCDVDAWLVADPSRPHPSDEVNHACAPNTGFADGDLWLVALRPIAAGEEITFHYATAMNEAGWEVACRCGQPACAGRIRSWCDLDATTQERLRPVALRYLRG